MPKGHTPRGSIPGGICGTLASSCFNLFPGAGVNHHIKCNLLIFMI